MGPDALVADEVLAVGDWRFQKKAFDRIGEMRELGQGPQAVTSVSVATFYGGTNLHPRVHVEVHPVPAPRELRSASANGAVKATGTTERRIVTRNPHDTRSLDRHPTNNRPADLELVIDASMRQQTGGVSHEVIVADNNSREDTRAVVDRAVARNDGAAALRPRAAPGVSDACNAGVSIARSSLIAFLDDDGAPVPTWVREVKDAFDQHPEWTVSASACARCGARRRRRG